MAIFLRKIPIKQAITGREGGEVILKNTTPKTDQFLGGLLNREKEVEIFNMTTPPLPA